MVGLVPTLSPTSTCVCVRRDFVAATVTLWRMPVFLLHVRMEEHVLKIHQVSAVGVRRGGQDPPVPLQCSSVTPVLAVVEPHVKRRLKVSSVFVLPFGLAEPASLTLMNVRLECVSMPAPVGISLEDICVTACPAGQDQTVTSGTVAAGACV